MIPRPFRGPGHFLHVLHKETYAFAAGNMLRATIATVDFIPTANSCDVAIEVEL